MKEKNSIFYPITEDEKEKFEEALSILARIIARNIIKEHQQMLSEMKHNNEAIKEEQNRLIPVTKWNDYYDWPPIGGLRSLIFNEHKNGFNKVIRRVNRRVLIDEKAFFDWVNEKNNTFS